MTISDLENQFQALKEEFTKFESGNKSSAVRARKILQEIKKIAQDLRGQIQSKKKQE